MLSVIIAECHYAKCRYAECRGAEKTHSLFTLMTNSIKLLTTVSIIMLLYARLFVLQGVCV
jgi:hypothetical protein